MSSTLEEQIKEQLGAVTLLKAKLKEKIISLGDNPRIKRLSGGAFIMLEKCFLFPKSTGQRTLIM